MIYRTRPSRVVCCFALVPVECDDGFTVWLRRYWCGFVEGCVRPSAVTSRKMPALREVVRMRRFYRLPRRAAAARAPAAPRPPKPLIVSPTPPPPKAE